MRLEPVVARADQPRMARCLDVFEDFCIVTGSVRPGVAVHVDVVPTDAHGLASARAARGGGG